MKREYFCCTCGLFHFVDQYQTDPETGYLGYVPHRYCPNPECESNLPENTDSYMGLIPVDTFGWAYYCESNGDDVKRICWTSAKYAPEDALEIYRRQGVSIRE